MTIASSNFGSLQNLTSRILTRPSTHIVMGLFILILDLMTGPFLLFPIMFVLPVTLSAWFYSTRLAYAFAILLPLGRFLIADFVDEPFPLQYVVGNALIRVAILVLMTYFVGRAARQKKQLEEKLSGLVNVCAWSRTIEYQGEWISIEMYLKKRFNIDTSHGISPAEARKVLGDLKNDRHA